MSKTYKYNPYTDERDIVQDTEVSDLRYLNIDFSNLPDSPVTNGFAKSGNTLEIWWNGTKVVDWTVTPATPDAGSPIGLLLSLTYS